MTIILARLLWYFDIENAREGDWLDCIWSEKGSCLWLDYTLLREVDKYLVEWDLLNGRVEETYLDDCSFFLGLSCLFVKLRIRSRRASVCT